MREKDDHTISDSEIIERLRQGDEEAFSKLFYTYKDKLYDFILGLTRSEHEAEDGVQDVFMKIWQHRDRLKEIDNFNAYLYGIARNQIIDAMRQFARNINAIDSLLDEQQEDATNTPIEQILTKEMNDALDEAIEQLSPQQRRAFQMRKLQGKSQPEIAEALHVSAATATGYTKEAVKNVRSYLLARYPELFVIALACCLDKIQ